MKRIGIPDNTLALQQAIYLQDLLKAIDIESEIVSIKKQVSEDSEAAINISDESINNTTLLQQALLIGDIDITVHSMNALGTEGVQGIQIAAVSERNKANDILLSTDSSITQQGPLRLKEGMRIGVSSPRRKALLNYYFHNALAVDIKGSISDNIKQLRNGDYDGFILANADLDSLESQAEGLYSRVLNPREFIPSPAQGVLAFQCRRNDKETKAILASIHRPAVSILTNVERTVLKGLNGNQDSPIGVYCEKSGKNYQAHAAYCPGDIESAKSNMKIARAIHITTEGLADSLLSQLMKKEGEVSAG